MTKRAIELAVPGLIEASRRSGGADLSSHRVEQPGAAEQLVGAMGEHLKAQHVDWDVALVEIGDDALSAVVERAGHDDDLMALVERILIELLPKPLTEVLGQAAAP